MKLDLYRPSWVGDNIDFNVEAVNDEIRGSWSEAAQRFASDRRAKLAAGQRPPSGVQPYLNRVLDEWLTKAGWDGVGRRYFKDDIWLRITFRHQMSLGSDLLDAIKVTAKGGARIAVVAAAGEEFLRAVTPNDASVLTSFEKLAAEARDLEGALRNPILIGCLRPVSVLPPVTTSIVFGPRPRTR